MAAIRYSNARFRAIVASVASAYILLHGHGIDVVGRAFVTPSFYLALAVSYPITLLLVYLVHLLTKKLDERYDWRTHLPERIVWQFLLGIVVPSLLDLVLIAGYSWVVGRSFSQSNFLLVDFPVIVLFIILLNVYYVVRYLRLTGPRDASAELPAQDEYGKEQQPAGQTSTLTVNYGGIYVQLNAPDEILYFHDEGRLIKVVAKGGVYAIRDTIGRIAEQYAAAGFCRINRNTIVNGRIVRGFELAADGGLRIVFSQDIEAPGESGFVVTQEYVPDFKAALQD